MRYQAAALGALIFMNGNVVAMSFVDRDVNELRDRSEKVVEGMVVRLDASCDKNDGCKSMVVVEIEKTLVGKGAQGDMVGFCSFAPLSAGFSYVFFLEPDVIDGHEKRDCALVAQRDAVFSRFNESVYRYMSPGSFVPAEVDGQNFLTGWVEVDGFDALLQSDAD